MASAVLAVAVGVAMLPTATAAINAEDCATLQDAGVNITCTQFNELTYIDFGHTAFVLVCMALVNLMTPGLAFFYGGLVREKSVLTMMMQSYISMGVTTIVWIVIGFSLAFGDPRTHFVGDPSSYPMMKDVNGLPLTYTKDSVEHVTAAAIPGIAFAGYQGMFAVITPALMTGAFADRFRFAPYLVFIAVWLVAVYCPVCHWVWGPEGWLKEWGVFDFAGGIVVHATAGFGALASLFVLGPRKPGPGETAEDLDTPHNIPLVALGTGLLWFGWFGFNAGSALNANEYAAYAALNSEISASVALTTWVGIDWFRTGKPNMVGLCVGAVAGLATITPAAGFVKPWAAAIIGLLAALFCYSCVELRKKMQWDDALDVWGVHGMGGVLGTIAIGVFGSMQGADASGELFGKQLAAVALVSTYSFVLTFLMLKIINVIPGLHLLPSEKELLDGLDHSFHGEKAYTHTPLSTSGPAAGVALPTSPSILDRYALTSPSQRHHSGGTSVQIV